MTITLANYFARATGYEADSSDKLVVTAEVSTDQTTLTLTRVGPGKAVVEITPSNSGGAGTTQSITVMVEEAPKPPALKKGMSLDNFKRALIADDTAISAGTTTAPITSGTGYMMYDLETYVVDPDGFLPQTLTFSTTTSDPKIAAVYEAKFTLTSDASSYTAPTTAQLKQTATEASKILIRARAKGQATITVTATDIAGDSTSWSFTVTVVTAQNNVPTVAGANFPGDAGSDNPYDAFVNRNTTKRFKSTATAPIKLKIDLSTLFNDTDVETNYRTTGDTWSFKAVSGDDKVVTATLESTNNSSSPDEYNVVITPVGSGSTKVHFTVTDSFGATAGASTGPFFNVAVNTRPKAEGAQSTPLTLTKLSESYDDLAVTTAFSTVKADDGTSDRGDAHQVVLVTDNGGYFSDADTGDTLTCRYDTRGVDIFAENFPAWADTNARTQINLASDEITALAKKGTAYIDVYCQDSIGEASPTVTLTIVVKTAGSMR